jgi:hypothetical protein
LLEAFFTSIQEFSVFLAWLTQSVAAVLLILVTCAVALVVGVEVEGREMDDLVKGALCTNVKVLVGFGVVFWTDRAVVAEALEGPSDCFLTSGDCFKAVTGVGRDGGVAGFAEYAGAFGMHGNDCSAGAASAFAFQAARLLVKDVELSVLATSAYGRLITVIIVS